MRRLSSFPILLFIASALTGFAIARSIHETVGPTGTVAIIVATIVISAFIALSVRVAAAWDRAGVTALTSELAKHPVSH